MAADEPTPFTNPEQLAFVAEFLARYDADLALGRAQTLAEYQALYPGHEAVLAAEWQRLAGDSEPLPERVAHYSVVRELGRGGQARVYLARDEKLERDVALKVLRGAISSRQMARFRREAEVAARLDHPGICTVFDTGEADGLTYIAMRHVSGRTLAHALDEATAGDYLADRDELFRVVHLFEKAARAVHAAHVAGIIHRDLKPGNLMITEGGEPVVVDFGLARDESVAAGAELTLTHEVFGTPVYMSPEQLRGGTELDRRTDIYSLGASLYEALTLHTPFETTSRQRLFSQILGAEPVSIGRVNRNLPKDLCTVVETAMAKDRDRRYRTAQDLAEDLRRVREYLPIEASPVGRLTRAWRWCQRNRTVATLSAVLFVVMSLALVVNLRQLSELRQSLVDARAGKQSKREKRLRDLLARAWQKLYSADSKKALPLLDEILELDPGNLEAIAGKAWQVSEDPRAALRVLDAEIAGLETVDPDLFWLRGFFLSATGNRDEAERELSRAGDRESSLRLYFRGLSAALGFRGGASDADRRRAVALFRRAISRSERPRFHYHHSVLMTAARMKDRELMDSAAADLEFLWPDSSATYDAIAQFYLPVDRERGLAALRWLVDHTREATPYCGLAVDAEGRGELDEALAHYTNGIDVEPGFAPIWWMRGRLHEKLDKRDAARTDYLAAIARDPSQPYYYAALLALHGKHSTWKQARTDLLAIVSSHELEWRAWKSLGKVCERLDDQAAAVRAYERAHMLYEHDPEVTARLAELRKHD